MVIQLVFLKDKFTLNLFKIKNAKKLIRGIGHLSKDAMHSM